MNEKKSFRSDISACFLNLTSLLPEVDEFSSLRVAEARSSALDALSRDFCMLQFVVGREAQNWLE